MQKKREYKIKEKQKNQFMSMLFDLKNDSQDLKVKKNELQIQIKKIQENIDSILDQEKNEIFEYDQQEIYDEKEKQIVKKLQNELSGLEY